jgi:hypothetical protein
MDQDKKSKSPKLGWTFEELASSLSVFLFCGLR